MATGGNGLVTWAMQTVQSGLAALLVSMVPFWVVMVDWLKPQGRRPGTRVVVGLVLGFTGVALLINPGDVGVREIDAFGALTIVLASMLWASGSIYSRHAPQPTSQALSSGMQMFGGGVSYCWGCRPRQVKLANSSGPPCPILRSPAGCM